MFMFWCSMYTHTHIHAHKAYSKTHEISNIDYQSIHLKQVENSTT